MFYIEGVTAGEREFKTRRTGEAKEKKKESKNPGVEDKDYKWIPPLGGQAGQI